MAAKPLIPPAVLVLALEPRARVRRVEHDLFPLLRRLLDLALLLRPEVLHVQQPVTVQLYLRLAITEQRDAEGLV